MIADVLSVIVLVVFGAAILLVIRERFTRAEYSLVWVSYFGHILAMFAQQGITTLYYGGGDMVVYHEYGSQIADAIQYDAAEFVPLTIKLLLQQDVFFPFFVLGTNSSTGTMVAATALLHLVTGFSMWGTAMVVTLWAFFGKIALYAGLRTTVSAELRSRVLAALLLVPSVVFWSAAILKESVAVGAIGLMVLGLVLFLRGSLARGVLLVATGAFVVGLVKPYVLFPFAAAAGGWFMMHRAQQRNRELSFRPITVALGAALAIGGVVLLGELFPKYSLEQFNEETARLQEIGSRVGGGSTYQIGGHQKRSAAEQLALSPIALGTSLFRPLPFEARNVLMILASIETTLLLVLALRVIGGRSRRWVISTVMSNPALFFSVIFVTTLGVGVGLASSNLGTLSRYRMPLMPFFALVLLLLSARDVVTALPRVPARRDAEPPQPQLAASASKPS